ncbi:MAG: SDR family oxidoreductase [Chloroflexota bacterium]
MQKPIALITGASRSIGIGHSIALSLAQSGWDIAITYWQPYDESMPWGSQPQEVEQLCTVLKEHGARVLAVEADLSVTNAPAQIFDQAEDELGPITGLVMSHCHSVDSDILTTTIEAFDLHFAVNTRATWLLIREFGKRFARPKGEGRIIAITSDHTVGNLPYGASKGAMDRIVLAAAHEFSDLGITANVINPGATDTGWMTEDQLSEFGSQVPLGRVGLPQDCANLVHFLCSEEGGWINGQLLKSNGGIA